MHKNKYTFPTEIVSNRPKQHNLKVTLPTFGKEENGKTARASWKSLFAKADYVLVWHDNEDIFDFQGASDLSKGLIIFFVCGLLFLFFLVAGFTDLFTCWLVL